MPKAPRKPSTPPRTITLGLAADALSFCPPYCDRDTWARLAMAGKSEFGDDWFRVWDEWSSRSESYDERNARDTWRSIKAGGKTTIGTLFGIAKDHGFTFPADDATAPVQRSAQIEAARLEAERLAEAKRVKHAADEAEYRRKADDAAQYAAQLWSAASDTGQGGYPARKGFKPYGCRWQADGTLVVPLRDAAGALQNVQLIAPKKPTAAQAKAGQLEKRFLAGGRKSGLWHVVGDATAAPAVLLAEGVATACSLHEATSLPTAVAFDAGNLVHVARALRALYPSTVLLICADDDRETEARTGVNVGRDKAAAAARAVHTEAGPAGVALPEGLPPGGSDWNDLATHAGLDVVRQQIEAALLDPKPPKPKRRQPAQGDASAGQDGPQMGAAGPAQPEAPGDASATDSASPAPGPTAVKAARSKPAPSDDEEQDEHDPFFCDESGVWHQGRDKDGKRKSPMRLGDPLYVTALTRDETDNGHGALIEFVNVDGKERQWAAPKALFGGEATEWAARLRDMGYRMGTSRAARGLLGQYIDSRYPSARVTCVRTIGWHGPDGKRVYVLPSRTIGDSSERRYVFQSDTGIDDTFRKRGELDQWRHQVAAKASGNSRVMFAIACAFAGPLMGPLNVQTGGVQVTGKSGDGKTTIVNVAVSVYGPPKFMQQWHGTSAGVEQVCVQRNSSLLAMDEIGQMDGRIVGDVVYQICNESQKLRSSRNILLQQRLLWRLFLLSSGEKPLADHMMEAGKKVNEGQIVRLPTLPADAGAGLGVFEILHGVPPGEGAAKAFAESLTAACAANYGAAGAAWIEWLVDHLPEATKQGHATIERLCKKWVPAGSHPQVWRVATRFALVGAAGELATLSGVTGWDEGESEWAARKCFQAWLDNRGHAGSGEEVAMLRQVRAAIEKNGDALFTWSQRVIDDRRPSTTYRMGIKRLVDENGVPLKFDPAHDHAEARTTAEASERMNSLVEYLVFPEAFNEMCKGFDPKTVAALLRARGYLKHEKDRFTIKHRLTGLGKMSVYHILPSIFDDEA